jgi:DNA (cytosine-5)-methyltransferase 1
MRLVDLFCGSGGFSKGAHNAGFDIAAAFDVDPVLTSSYCHNFPKTKLVLEDVSLLDGKSLEGHAGGLVDGIFGGPPCQGFSDIGKRDPADIRRKLVRDFFRVVTEADPTFFVMENVRGLAYADSRGELDEALKLVVDRYEVLEPMVWDASQFGAATKRNRIFVIGIHKDRADPLTFEDIQLQKRPPATVWQALADLEKATFVLEKDGFDFWRTKSVGRPSTYAKSLRASDRMFTGHRPTIHTPQVIKRFETVASGAVDKIGRHPRLTWDGQCPTLRAGTGADKGSYQSVRPLHPERDRVITVREAARLQGFPDSHRFHPTVWHSFRMIGNSVCPIMAEAIFRAIREKLKAVSPRETILAQAAE